MGLNPYLTQKLFPLFLALLCIWGITTSLQYGAASLDYYKMKSIMSLWQEKGLIDSLEQYQKAKGAAYQAHQSHPAHSVYVDLIGQIHEWGAIAGFEDEKQALQQAKNHYLDATTIRPTWPVTWASLANVKWRLQEFDDEMLLYLHRANQFGPRMSEVNLFYSEFGLALYKTNNMFLLNIRDQVKQHLSSGLRYSKSRHSVRALIKKYDTAKIVCFWLQDEPYESVRKFIPGCKR